MQFHHTQFVANARCCSVCYRIPPLSDRAGLWEESGMERFTLTCVPGFYLGVGKICHTVTTEACFLVMLLIP